MRAAVSRRKQLFGTASVFVFLLIATLFRVCYLDRIPTGIVMDEFDYVFTAKSVYHTGSNLYGNWSPWSLTVPPNEIPKGELSYLVSLPFVGPFGLSLFTARIGFALMSVVFVWVMYALGTTVFGPVTGVIAGFIAAINPWSVYFGRTAYDVPISIIFYMISVLCLFRLRGPRLLLTIIPLFLAFYGYIGTKIIFIPFTVLSTLYAWFVIRKREDTRWFVLLFLGSVIMFVHFMLRLHFSAASFRMGQVFTPFDPNITSIVNTERRLTLESPVTALFENKITMYIQAVTEKFLGAFSPSLLFTNGEGIATFSLWKHGLFYPIDAIFLVLGGLFLFHEVPMLLLFFIVSISIATLPSVLSNEGTTYVHRSSLMYPYIMLLISYGITKAVAAVRKQHRLLLGIGIATLYGVVSINFAYLYFFRYPYYNSEAFGLSQRLYTRYSVLAAANGVHVVHLTPFSELYFRNYLFYANIPNERTYPDIRSKLHNATYSWSNTTFTKNCPSKAEISSGKTAFVLSDTSPCKEMFINKPMIVIPSLADGASLYFIFNDRICSQYALSNYPTGYSLQDFRIEELSEKRFCERFLIRYTNPLYQPQTKDGNWVSAPAE